VAVLIKEDEGADCIEALGFNRFRVEAGWLCFGGRFVLEEDFA
jgi:hypothetical protein